MNLDKKNFRIGLAAWLILKESFWLFKKADFCMSFKSNFCYTCRKNAEYSAFLKEKIIKKKKLIETAFIWWKSIVSNDNKNN